MIFYARAVFNNSVDSLGIYSGVFELFANAFLIIVNLFES